jgi:hypothetical protein
MVTSGAFSSSAQEVKHMRPRQNPLRGVAGGLFIIGLAFAFFFSRDQGVLFLPILFFALAASTVIGAFSTYNPRGVYSGLHGAVWLAGIGLCFLIGFWPWILLPIGVSSILGALLRPITTGIGNMGMMAPPLQAPNQPPYQPPASGPAPVTYQEGGRDFPYPPDNQSAGQ